MKPAILTLAASLALSATVFAGPPAHKSGGPTFHNGKTNIHVGNNNIHVSNHNIKFQPTFKSFPNYHLKFGVKFSGGYFYKGFHHYHWSKVYWSPGYGCRVYYDPYTLVEYYWCPWDNCFYPVTYKPYGRYVF